MSNNGDVEIERLAAAFAALANPQRLRIFVALAARCCAPQYGPGAGARFCCAGEVGAGVDVAPSTASHHLKQLRQAGLVHVERRGRTIDCWASQEGLERLASFFVAWLQPARGSGRRAAGDSRLRPRGRSPRTGTEKTVTRKGTAR